MSVVERLCKRADYLIVQRRGVRSAGNALVLIGYRGSNHAGMRVGLTVSKQVGNAVMRNLIKRRLRHLVREEVAAACCFDLVIVTLPPVKVLTFSDLRHELFSLLRRLEKKLLSRQSERKRHVD